MARLETWYKQDLKRPLVVHKHTDVFNQDSKGNLIGVEVYSDGEPVVLSGSISGYCLLANGTTVPAVGASRSGNKASVLIPQAAYSVPGPITITIKNVEGDNITTLCATVGIVRQSVSGNLVNPGSVVTDWSNDINAQLQAVQTAADNVGAIVAAPFDENTVYVVGNYVTNNGNLYRITADHASGVAWADTAKVQCTVGNELSELKSAINEAFIDSPNLFDKNNIVVGKTLLGSSGHTINDFQDATNWCVSNIFEVESGQIYTFNSYFDTSTARVCFYDANGLYKGGAYATANGDGTYSASYTDATIRYARFAFKTTVMDASTFMLIKGTNSSFPQEYVPFGKYLNPSYAEKQIEDALENYNPIIGTSNIEDNAVTAIKTNFIIHDPKTNFIDKNKLTIGKIINQSGYEANANGWCCTDYIELAPGATYYISDYVYKKYWGFYNESKQVVGCYNDDGEIIASFTFPNDAKYARFSFQTTETYINGAYVSLNSGIPREYGYKIDVESEYPTDFTGKDICAFNKILCIGDSITYGGFNADTTITTSDKTVLSSKYSYPAQLQKITGVNVTNMGESGDTSVDWYTNHASSDVSGHDCCIIELGINDYYRLGGWTTESETAFNNIIQKVKTANKGIKIFVSTIPNGQSYVNDGLKTVSEAIRTYVNGLADNNVILLDEAQYGHLIESIGYNAGHLSAYGYYRLAQDYANYISWYMNTHRDEFRFIQFIGTNYTYSGGGSNNGNV